jgi:hypothetical protein
MDARLGKVRWVPSTVTTLNMIFSVPIHGLVGKITCFHVALVDTYPPYGLASTTWNERYMYEEWVNKLLHTLVENIAKITAVVFPLRFF